MWSDDEICFNSGSKGVNGSINSKSRPVTIYPNPAIDNIAITYNSPNAGATFNLYNLAGRLIQSETLPAGNDIFTLNLDYPNTGLYFYNIIFTDGVTTSGKLQLNK